MASAKGGKSAAGPAAILSAAPQGRAAAAAAAVPLDPSAMGESPLLTPLSNLHTPMEIAVTRSGCPRSDLSTPRVGSPSGLEGQRVAPHTRPRVCDRGFSRLPRVSPAPQGVTSSQRCVPTFQVFLPNLGRWRDRLCCSLSRDPLRAAGEKGAAPSIIIIIIIIVWGYFTLIPLKIFLKDPTHPPGGNLGGKRYKKLRWVGFSPRVFQTLLF